MDVGFFSPGEGVGASSNTVVTVCLCSDRDGIINPPRPQIYKEPKPSFGDSWQQLRALVPQVRRGFLVKVSFKVSVSVR